MHLKFKETVFILMYDYGVSLDLFFVCSSTVSGFQGASLNCFKDCAFSSNARSYITPFSEQVKNLF